MGLGFATTAAAHAAVFVWDGGHNARSSWSFHHNWNPNNNGPTSDGTADLIFSGDVRLDSDAGGAWNINSITFNSSAGAFVISGGPLTLQGTSVAAAIDNQDADTQTLNSDLILGSSQTWSATSGELLFNGTVTLGANNLTISGANGTSMVGAISGTGGLVKTGSGTLTLLGANTYSGGTTISAGTVIGNSNSLQGDIANQASLVFDQDFVGTYAGIISGAGSMTKIGSGTLTLSNSNTYTGATVISAGTLSLGSADALSGSTAVSVASGATLALGAGAETVGSIAGSGSINLGSSSLMAGGNNTSTTFAGVISGSGGLTKAGSGTLTLAGANTYSGGTTISGGTLAGNSTSLQGDITNQSALVFDQAAAGTYSGVVSGTGTFTKNGAGTLTLSGSNTYSGATTISSGTLSLGAADALSDSTAVSIASGATLALATNSETVGSIAGGGSINLGSFSLTAGGDGTSTTFAGAISGSGGFAKAGAGTLTLTGANTYSGGTTVSAGTLAGNSTSLQGSITNNASLVFDQASAGTYAGVISGSGDVTKSGPGALTLSGASTYTGATTVSSGTLAIGSSDRLADSTSLTLGTSATFHLDGHSERIGTLTYNTSFIDFGAAGAANHLLFGDGSASSTGTLTINNYSLGDGDEFAFNGTLGAGFLDGVYFFGIGGGTVFATGQTITGYGSGWTLIRPDDSPFDIWSGGGSDDNWSTNANWADGNSPISGIGLKIEFDGTTRLDPIMNGSYTLNTLRFAEGAGAFTLTASAANSATFGGSVASIIQLSANNQTIDIPLVLDTTTVVETSGAGDLTFAGAISGSSGVMKVGAGTAVFEGDNSYAGLTTVREGTLVARHNNALGATSPGTTVGSGAALELQNNITIGDEALSLSGTLLNASGANAYQGAISGTGALSVSGGTLTLSGTASNTFTGDTVVGGGQLDLAKTSGATAVSGNLVIGDGSGTDTVRLVGSNQIADTATVTLSSGGTPVFNVNDQTETIGALSSSNTAAAVQLGSGTLTTGTLTTGAANTDSTFAGVISGSGNLAKVGSGTFTLSGANTYSGTTTVSAGTLAVGHDSALGSTAAGTNVSTGATLELQNNVTIGGTLLDVAIGGEALALDGTLLNAGGANSYSGAISGSGGVSVTGGTLTLAGSSANTYSGSTTVSGGQLDLGKTAGVTAIAGNVTIGDGSGTDTLRLLAANQIADTSTVTLGSGGTPIFNLNNHSETIGALSSTNPAASVQVGSGTLTVGASNTNSSFAGVISGTGDFVKSGTGTLTLSGANTQSGNVNITGGTLALGASDTLSTSADVSLGYGTTLALGGVYSQRIDVLSYNDATLDFGPTGTGNHLLFTDDGARTGFLTVTRWTQGSDVFGVVDTAVVDSVFLENVFFSGIGVGIGAELASTPITVGGYGSFFELRPITTFVWDGGQNNGPTADQDNWSKGNNWGENNAPGLGDGKAIVMAGIVQTTNDMDGAYNINSLLFHQDAGAFTINSSTGDTLTIRGGGIFNQASTTQTLNVSVALAASQTWGAAAGDLVIAGPSVFNGSSSLTITGDRNTTISAAIEGGTGALIKNGSGTLTLSGANTYTGETAVDVGTVVLHSDTALGSTAAGTSVAAGATLKLENNVTIGDEALSLSGTLVNDSGANTYGGAISGSGSVSVAGGTLALGGSASNTYTGATTISGGQIDLAKTGGATAIAGDVTIGSGSGPATLRLLGTDQIADTATVALSSGGTPVFNLNGFADTIGTLTSTNAAASVQLGTGTLTTGAANTDSTFAGVISGAGNLVKTGSGTLTLTGANTHTGNTAVDAGAIVLGASGVFADASTITIGSGALLDLAGFHETVASVSGAGTIDFGLGSDLTLLGGTGVLTGNLTGSGRLIIGAGATLSLSNDFSNADLDLVLAGGTLRLTSGFTQTFGSLSITGNSIIDFGDGVAGSILHVNDVSAVSGVELSVQNWTDAIDYFFSAVSTGEKGTEPNTQIIFSGFTGADTKWQDYSTQITPVPEPSTYGAMFMGTALGFVLWRRRRLTKKRPLPSDV